MNEELAPKLQLQNFISECIKEELPLVLEISKPNSPFKEYIVNPIDNLPNKLHYITKAYDPDLYLKSCKDIKITGWGNWLHYSAEEFTMYKSGVLGKGNDNTAINVPDC